MSINLSRNTRLFVSTVDKVTADTYTNLTPSNTFEVPILTGYGISQAATTSNITLDEAGDAPIRGQKIFNTALDPADISFSTYIRPFIDSNDVNNHNCLERVLWEALVGEGDQTALTTNPFLNTTLSTTSFLADFENSNVHELLKLQLFFLVDNTVYKIEDVAINSATIDFAIDAISQINWAGFGITLAEYTNGSFVAADAGSRYKGVPTINPDFIKNKLSTLVFKNNNTAGVAEGYFPITYTSALATTAASGYTTSTTYDATITVDGGSPQTINVTGAANKTVNDVLIDINNQLDGANATLSSDGLTLTVTSLSSGSTSTIAITDGATNALLADLGSAANGTLGTASAGTGTPTIYNIPITSGTITIDNGVTFLTPDELAKVNTPIGSFTGTRAISGSLGAYLKTGTVDTGGLLATLVSDTNRVTQDYEVEIVAGGSANTPRASFLLPHAHLVIPAVDVQDVVSTTIDFTGLGQDIEVSDELFVEYTAATSVAY